MTTGNVPPQPKLLSVADCVVPNDHLVSENKVICFAPSDPNFVIVNILNYRQLLSDSLINIY